MKIVVIGAASAEFGRKQVADILQAKELQGRGVTMSLVDVNAEALEVMVRVARRMKAHVGSDVVIESTTDRCEALPGARYVIMAVARDRWATWEQDFRVPLSYGFRHVLGENGGPGALFHALRNFEIILPICHDIEQLCPDALLMNFTNPEARVLHAICQLTKVRAVGLCHGVLSALDRVVFYLQKSLADLDIVSAGMNHFYCLLQVRDRRTGRDYLPELLAKARGDMSSRSSPLFRKFADIFGLFVFPSDDHLGEYLSYGAEFVGVKWKYGQESRKVGPVPDARGDALRQYADGNRPADDPMVLPRSREHAIPIICDMELGRENSHPAVNVMNTEGYIENLPRNGIVEVPADVSAGSIHPRHVGPIPEPIAAMIRTQFAIHNLLTEAYRTRSKKLLLQALLLDPVVNNMTQAERLLDDMLALQAEYLPTFA